MQVLAAEVLSDIVPELWLGKDGELGIFGFVVERVSVDDTSLVVAPNIDESAETKSLHSQQVLHSPNT